MPRFSNPAFEVGASSISALVLPHNGFIEANDVYKETIAAIDHEQDTSPNFGYNSRERGNYIEPALGKYCKDMIKWHIGD